MIPAQEQNILIPEQETPLIASSPNSKDMLNIAKKAAIAAASLGHDYQQAKIKYDMHAAQGNVQAIKGDVSTLKFNKQRLADAKAISDSLATDTQEQIQMRMQNYALQKIEKDALEKQYVEYLSTSKSPQWRALAEQNKDIFQRKAQEIVMAQTLLNIRSKYAGLEAQEEKGWFSGTLNEAVDFFKVALVGPEIIDWFNPIEGTLSTQVNDLRALVTMGRNLPEEQRPEWVAKFEDKLESLGFFAIDNPQDQVDLIDYVMMNDSDLSASNAMTYLNFIGAGAYAKLGAKIIKGRNGAKQFVPRSATGNTKDVDLEVVAANEASGGQKSIEALEDTEKLGATETVVSANKGAIDEANLKKSILTEAREELLPIAGNKLDRGQVKELKNAKFQLERQLNKVTDEADADDVNAIIGKKNLNARRAKKEQKKYSVEEGRRLGAEERDRLQAQLDRINSQLDAHSKAAKAEADLTRIDQGIIPAAYQKTYNNLIQERKAMAQADEANPSQATLSNKDTNVPKNQQVDNVVSREDAIDQISSLRSPESLYSRNIAGDLYRKLELTRNDLLARINRLASPANLNEKLQELEEAMQGVIQGKQIVNTTIDQKDGTILMTYGREGSVPFATERAALNSATSYGFKPTDFNVIETPHGFMVELRVAGDMLEEATGELSLSMFKAGLGNMEDVVPDIIGIARLSEDAENALFKTIERVVNRDLRKFYGKKGKNLFAVIDTMQQRGKTTLDGEDIGPPRWYSVDEFAEKYNQLHKKYPTNDEVKAYGAYRMLNDFDAELKYNIISKDVLSRQDSIVTVTMRENPVNILGRNVDVSAPFLKSTNRESLLVIADDVEYIGARTLDEKGVSSLVDNYKVIEVNPANREDFVRGGYSDVPVKYVLVPKATQTRQATARDLMSYVEGGRMRNAAKHFIKVGREVTDEAGNVFRLEDKTLFSARNKKLAKQAEEKINKLVTDVDAALKSGVRLSDDEIFNIGLSKAGISTWDEATKFIKANKLLNGGTIRAVRDREMVEIQDGISNTKMSLDERAVTSGYYGSRLFGARSTEGIKDVDFGDMQMMNPMEALADSLTMTSRYASTLALKERSLHYMKSKFGKYLDTKSTNPFRLLEADIVNTGENIGLKKSIEAHQKFLSNMFSQMTDAEMAWKVKMDKMMNWVFDNKDRLSEFFGRGGPSKDTLTKRENRIDYFGRDPVTRIRGVTFHSTLGMLSLPSFIMQAINVTNIMAIAGRTGMKAGYQALGMRAAMFAHDPDTIDAMAKSMWKAGGFDSADDLKDSIRLFQDLGYDNIGLNHAFIAGMNGMQLQGTLSKNVSEISRVFFDQGELLNRLTAMRTAMLEYKAANPSVDVFERSAREWIANRTHTLTLGMSRSDNQLALRDNWFATMTQFWSYPLRMTNAMLSSKLGGSKSFTSAEKTRLVAVNAALWGAAGVPIYNFFAPFIADKMNLDEGSRKALVDGLFDWSLWAMTGADTDMGNRVGNAEFYIGLWNNLTSDSTALEFFSGAAGSRGGAILGVFDAPAQVIRAGLNSDPSVATQAGIATLGRLSSGFNNWHKFYIGMKYNMVRTRAGVDMFDVSDAEVWFQAWGVPPKGYADANKLFKYNQNEKLQIKDATEGYLILLREQAKAYEAGDEQAMESVENAMAIYASSLDNEYIRSSALRAALKQSTASQTMMEKMIQNHVRKKDKGAEGLNEALIKRNQETIE